MTVLIVSVPNKPEEVYDKAPIGLETKLAALLAAIVSAAGVMVKDPFTYLTV